MKQIGGQASGNPLTVTGTKEDESFLRFIPGRGETGHGKQQVSNHQATEFQTAGLKFEPLIDLFKFEDGGFFSFGAG